MGLEDVVSMENTSRRQSSSLQNFLKGLTLASALGLGAFGQPAYAGPNNNEVTANAATPQLTAAQKERLYEQHFRISLSQHLWGPVQRHPGTSDHASIGLCHSRSPAN